MAYAYGNGALARARPRIGPPHPLLLDRGGHARLPQGTSWDDGAFQPLALARSRRHICSIWLQFRRRTHAHPLALVASGEPCARGEAFDHGSHEPGQLPLGNLRRCWY